MYNWNKIEIRYCDGASVSGDKTTPDCRRQHYAAFSWAKHP